MKQINNYLSYITIVPLWTVYLAILFFVVTIILIVFQRTVIHDLKVDIYNIEKELDYFAEGNQRLIYQVRKKEEILKAAQTELRELREIATRPYRKLDSE